jgi:hypothetical protein
MIIAVWVATALGIALWSLAAWGMHAALTLDPHWVGGLAPLVDQVPYSGVLAYWAPGWQELARMSLATMQATLAWVVVVTWLIGSLLLLGGAIVCTLLIQLMRGRRAAAAAFAR